MKVSVLTRGGPTDRGSGSNNERREVSRGHSTLMKGRGTGKEPVKQETKGGTEGKKTGGT